MMRRRWRRRARRRTRRMRRRRREEDVDVDVEEEDALRSWLTPSMRTPFAGRPSECSSTLTLLTLKNFAYLFATMCAPPFGFANVA
eukprot:3638252-Pyramimonas_sp.AAC.1